jgi:hypothetical protein
MVLLQMLFLEKGWKYAAGFCWLLAMLKTQIGLAFIGPFRFRNQWRGCLVAFGALVGLSLFACAQTDVSLQRVACHWLFGQDLGFSFGNIAGIPFNSARLSPFLTARFVVLVALVGASLIVYRLSLLQRMKPAHASLLELTGAYAVLGRLAFYHRPHDDVMLFPAFLASLSLAIHSRRRADWALFSAVFFSLAQPSEWVMNVPKLAVLNGFIWLVLGGRLLYSQFRAGLFKEC